MSPDKLVPDGHALDAVLERFEDAWARGGTPRLEEYVPSSAAAGRVRALEELIKIDLSYRWRRPGDGPAPPRLEQYLERFPELGPAGRLSLELIAAEYWVRRQSGDRVAPQEYLDRFAAHGNRLLEKLQQVDAELAKEANGPAAWQPGAAVPTAALLADLLCKLPLLTAPQQAEVGRLRHHYAAPNALARELLQRGWLTPYQANQALQGRTGDLVVGPYVVLERLGEGGAGRVLKARHQRMERVVALKLIRRDLLADAEIVSRFYREIQVLGKLSHPNVVHGLDAGPIGGNHVLVMEYVDGIDLDRLVKQSGPLPVAEACSYIRQAALGLEHAHQHGLVHRDIKPSNLMLVRGDSPTTHHAPPPTHQVKILDLGLARLRVAKQEGQPAAGDATSQLTQLSGIVMMGTPDYLAPEQALDFHGADIRADIYALGCTLFYLLTGQPPFAGGTMPQKLMRHQQADPPPLAQFRADVPAPVEALLRRLLAKRPEERFATPGAVVAALDDLRKRGVIGGAGRVSLFQTVWSRPRRRTVLVGCLLVLALALGLWAILPRRSSSTASLPALNAGDIPAAERYPWQPAELVAVRGTHRWHTADSVGRLAVSADGKTIASGSGYQIQLWDAGSGRETAVLKGPAGFIQSLAFAPDGRALASASQDTTVRLWDLGTRTERTLVKPTGTGVGSLAFAPDGKILASGRADGTVRLLDAATGEERSKLTVGGKEVTSLAFVRNGRLLAAASADGTARLWDFPGLAEQAVVHCGDRQQTSFFGDGRALACGFYSDPLKIWETSPAQVRSSWKLGDHLYLRSLAAAPDGRTVATGFAVGNAWGPCGLKLWDPASGRLRAALPGHSGPINDLAYFPDSRTLVSAGSDATIRLWDVDSGQERDVSRARWGRFAPVVAIAPDGRLLGAARLDETVQLCDLVDGAEAGRILESTRVPLQPGFGPEGRPLLWGLKSLTPHVWDVHTGQDRALPYTLPATVGLERLTLAPDGKTLAVPGKSGTVALLDFATGKELPPLSGAVSDVRDLQFTPDGTLLLAVGTQGAGKLWHVASRQEQPLALPALPGAAFLSAAPAPDGRRLALAVRTGARHEVLLWDVAAARVRQRWELPWPTRPSFAPDGRHLILSNANGTIYLLRLND